MRLAPVAVAALITFALPSQVLAQPQLQRSFHTQLFEPAIGVDSNTYFSVEGPGVVDHLGFGVGLMMNYQRKPLVLYWERDEAFDIDSADRIDVVENQLTANLVGALGLHWRWLHAQVGLDLPINLALTGREIDTQGVETGDDLSATGIGDLRIQLKGQIIRDLAGFSLAFSPILTVPTGDDGDFGGEQNVTFRPMVVAGYRIGDFGVAANVGWLFRENTTYFSSEISDRLLYGVAGSYKVHDRVVLLAELFGRAGFSTASDCDFDPALGDTVCRSTSANDLDAYPLEADVGAQVKLTHAFTLTTGVGFGLIRAIGSPQVRVIAGIRWAPDFKDSDGDGIYDYKDACPTEPEDMDGFQDSDGCPDLDNDGDLIPDAQDQCPDEPEDKDTFQDEDGCPDPDNDGDGIPDIKDACPFEPETFNGFQDEDGCPDVPDRDGDGIPDAQDKCPDQPEDLDGFEDEDGCPDPDNDGDGVPDSFDDCPNEPEDMDGFQDDDGCPDLDNDGDGVPDAQDKCPDQPETINGYKDDDGCPDRGAVKVKIEKDKLIITERIYFATARDKIMRRSFSILDQIALTLKANPQVGRVRIEGHTDSRGNADKNKKLSQARAEAVQSYLINKGVDQSRLVAEGYGDERPIAANETARGRADNRRVEFVILEAPAPEEVPAQEAPMEVDPE